jgi:hypothetical protein
MSGDYMSGPHDGPHCRCKHDGQRWTRRCTAAEANDHAEASRWAADHVRQNPATVFTPEYWALAEGHRIGIGLDISSNEDLR